MFEIARLKPGVSRAFHLFVFSLLWTAVGTGLLIRGWCWLEGGVRFWVVVAALGIGTMKSIFILDKVSRRSLLRILTFQGKICLGAVYPWKMWLLVGGMMLSGYALRTLTKPGIVLAGCYMAIGWALLLSSRLGWSEWYRHREQGV